MKRSTLAQLAGQCRATMALLPYAVALGIPDELAVAVFGQAMNILNHLPDVSDVQRLNYEINERFETRSREKKQPKTQEEKRRYQRHYKRIYRARHRLAELEARERGLAKLTPEERAALKLPAENIEKGSQQI